LKTDNAAGRLLHILNEGKKINKNNTSSKEAWSKLLNIKVDNSALLMSRLGKVMELPNQIIDEINNYYPNQKKSYTHWNKKVNDAFASQDLNGKWNTFIDYIDEHTINYLTMSVDLLDNKENTKLLTEKEISDIKTKINILIDDIIKLDTDDNFKKYMTRYLRKIIIAIDEYKITGVSPILESLEVTLGHAFVDESYRNNIQKTEFGTKLMTTLTAIASVVTIAVGLPQISDLSIYLPKLP